MRAVLALAIVGALARPSAGQVAHTADPEAHPADPIAHTAEPEAPPGDQASGIVVEEEPRLRDKLRWVPRVLLFVPRWTWWAIGQPFKGAGYLYERYQLVDRIEGIFYSADGTYGLFPTATYTSDFGLVGGLRFVHSDLFGAREYLRVRVNAGNEYQSSYGFILRSGERFGSRFRGTLDVHYERRPNERFFGIGNADELDAPPDMRIDPSLADAALSSRFRQNWFRAVVRAEATLVGALQLRLASALAIREFGNFDMAETNRGIEQRFDTSKLVGYDRGVENVYTEAQLVYDSRRQTSPWQSRAIDSAGWYGSVHVGRAQGISGDPTAFWRYGFEVQQPIDLYRGSRVLTLRAYFDAIHGGDGRTDETVAFIDLPRLGGTELLRGYAADRFRDRAVALVTAEYSWDLGNALAAYTFVDVGRAYSTLEDVRASGAHIGFGGGIQVHTNQSFLMRGQLAASREGDVFVEAAFAPAFGRRERAGR